MAGGRGDGEYDNAILDYDTTLGYDTTYKRVHQI